ncbi:MAG TPA: IPT/TIG domain-containing protein [Steroidobacteraceae bacterium]|nr:IPT/TIG domain-containing protein [Steroidobacteraceae bacterium]
MHDLFVHWRKAGLLLVLLLAGCGGGGDSSNGSGTGSSGAQASTDSLSFKAASPSASTPAAQVVSVTFGANIAHLAITQRGLAIGNVSSTFSGRTAQISIAPDSPSSLGPGVFEGKVAVTGYVCADATCSAFAAGDSQTISVSYQISPAVLYVAPHVATSQTSQAVALRGFGFNRFNITDVLFGTTAASSFVVTNSSEIIVQAPALAAGSYPVIVKASDHEGEIPSDATLVVVDPVAYAAQTLSYPNAATRISSLLYDPERRSILVASDAPGSQLVRYAYDAGAWSPQSSGAVTSVRDAALSITGAQLYVLSDTQLTLVDPVSLAAGTSYTAPNLPSGAFLKSIALSNTNTAYITTGIDTTGATSPVYAFSEPSAAIIGLNAAPLNYATIEANTAGTTLVAVQGDPASTTALPVYLHTNLDSGTSLSQTGVTLQQTAAESALDRTGNRIVLGGSLVYEGTLNLSASIPVADAVAVKPDGTRVYAYYSASNTIETFDTTTFTNGQVLTSLGTTTLTVSPGATVKMTITPDAQTLILAGAAQIVIQPTPSF